jgi:hypothetical protein
MPTSKPQIIDDAELEQIQGGALLDFEGAAGTVLSPTADKFAQSDSWLSRLFSRVVGVGGGGMGPLPGVRRP